MARPDRKNTKSDSRSGAKGFSASDGGGFTAGFEQHQSTAVDSLLRLLLDPVASLLTWAVIGIALALPLSLLLLLQNLQQLGAGLEQGGTISLYMNAGMATEALDEFAEMLARRSDIAGVEFISADAALREFQSKSGFGEVLQGLDENPLPAVFLVTATQTDTAAVTALHAALRELPGVDVAQLDLQWMQRLNAMVGVATRLTLLLAGMLGLGVVLAIGNTVRLAIENRRAEIVVVKLVGGTDAYVARPFLYTGLWYGVGGGLLAVLLITLALFGLQAPVSTLMGTYDRDFSLIGLGISNGFLVLAGAGLLGWLGAWVSVLRHLRAIEPR